MMKLNIGLHKPRGTIEYQVLDKEGTLVDDSGGEFDNLVLDQFFGYHKIGRISFSIVLGAGTVTIPKKTDTALSNQIAKSPSSSLRSEANQGYAYKEGFVRIFSITSDFSNIEGDISEIGLMNVNTLITRALVKDQEGNPIQIPITKEQTLRITYRLYWYFPLIAAQGIFNTPMGDIEYTYALYEYKNPNSFLREATYISLDSGYYPGIPNHLVSFQSSSYTAIKLLETSEEGVLSTGDLVINHSQNPKNFYWEGWGGVYMAYPYPSPQVGYLIWIENNTQRQIPALHTATYKIEISFGWIIDETEIE